MRLRFSRRTDYALRAVIHLAQHDELVKRRELAELTRAPSAVVAQALADVVGGGIAHATAGPSGGYRLARPADQISVLDVVRAVEPEAVERRCVLHERACRKVGSCPLHGTVEAAEAAYFEQLAAVSLADVAGLLADDGHDETGPGTSPR